jgi:hypothetical protein
LRPLTLVLVITPFLAGIVAAQNGLSNGRSRAPRQGEPEFQLGILGSRSGFSGPQETGGGYFLGLRLPVRPWLFADFETGHLYRVSHTDFGCQCDQPPPPSTGPFVRTRSELTEAFPLALPTGFFAARLSGQLGSGSGAKLRLQLGARHRNASHTWLPTAGLALQFPSRSTPFFVELEAARYQLRYRDVREEFLDGVLTASTTEASARAPLRGVELAVRLGLSFGPTPRARKR